VIGVSALKVSLVSSLLFTINVVEVLKSRKRCLRCYGLSRVEGVRQKVERVIKLKHLLLDKVNKLIHLNFII
jgi:uncharacterized protein YoxC